MPSIHSVTDTPVNLSAKSLVTETFLNWQNQADPAEVVQQKGSVKVTGKFLSRNFYLKRKSKQARKWGNTIKEAKKDNASKTVSC